MLSRLRDWAYTFSLGTAPDDPPLNNSKEPLTNAPTKEEVIHLDKPVLGQRTPFHERGASSDCCLECCGTPRCMTCCKYTSYTLAVTLGWFIVWNLLKIPYYAQDLMTNVTYDTEACSVDPVPRECYGFEFQANLGAWVGWRSYKLFASPANFLAPHAMMGCLLEAFFIAALVGGWGVVRKLSYAMLPLAFVFGLHVLPAENGFPSREAGVPANLLCVIVIWLAVGVGAAGLLGPRRYPQLRPKGDMALYWAWVVIACDANLAPVAEWGLILAFGGASSPDGEQPLPQSGHRRCRTGSGGRSRGSRCSAASRTLRTLGCWSRPRRPGDSTRRPPPRGRRWRRRWRPRGRSSRRCWRRSRRSSTSW